MVSAVDGSAKSGPVLAGIENRLVMQAFRLVI